MIRDITIPAKHCVCDLCGYRWVSTAAEPPKWCGNPKCRSREWNGKKQRSHRMEITLPAPRKPGRPKTITLVETGEHL
jgi:hypothetical protein